MKTDYGTLYIYTYIHTQSFDTQCLLHKWLCCTIYFIFLIFNINSLSEINTIYADPTPPKAGDI